MIISQVFDESRYHIVIFGTCGIVPAELETMYPFAHYKYMLGKCNDETVRADFLKIETDRWPVTWKRPGTSIDTGSRTVSASSAKP